MMKGSRIIPFGILERGALARVCGRKWSMWGYDGIRTPLDYGNVVKRSILRWCCPTLLLCQPIWFCEHRRVALPGTEGLACSPICSRYESVWDFVRFRRLVAWPNSYNGDLLQRHQTPVKKQAANVGILFAHGVHKLISCDKITRMWNGKIEKWQNKWHRN